MSISSIKKYGIGNETKHVIITVTRKLYYLWFKITHLKMYKHPKSLIPANTYYCYNILDVLPNKSGVRTKVCPFHRHTKLFPKYAGVQDLCMYNGDDCMGDDCKTCGINYPDDDIGLENIPE